MMRIYMLNIALIVGMRYGTDIMETMNVEDILRKKDIVCGSIKEMMDAIDDINIDQFHYVNGKNPNIVFSYDDISDITKELYDNGWFMDIHRNGHDVFFHAVINDIQVDIDAIDESSDPFLDSIRIGVSKPTMHHTKLIDRFIKDFTDVVNVILPTTEDLKISNIFGGEQAVIFIDYDKHKIFAQGLYRHGLCRIDHISTSNSGITYVYTVVDGCPCKLVFNTEGGVDSFVDGLVVKYNVRSYRNKM